MPAALVTLALVAAACPGPEPTNDPAPEPDPPSNTQPDAEPDEPEPAEPVEPDNGAATEADLADIWTAFHAVWVEQAALDDPDPDAFDGLALEPDEAVATLVAQRGEARIVTTDAELWPRLDITDQAAQVADCAIVTQHPEGQQDSAATVTVRWEATATVTADGWRIETALPVGLFCVAEELERQSDGAWRVVAQAGTRDTDCIPGSTNYAVS